MAMPAKWKTEGDMLGQLIIESGIPRSDFAQMIGVSDDVLSNLVRGVTRLRGDRHKKAALVLGLTQDALRKRMGGKSPSIILPQPKRESPLGKEVPMYRSGFVNVPIFGSVPAGKPGANMSDAIEYVEMPDWGGDFERWGRVITGDSMSPEFQPNDIVIFESRRPEPNHGVYAWKDGEDTFKVLRVVSGQGELWPTNSEGHDHFTANGFDILGIAIRRIRRIQGGITDTREYPHGFIHVFSRP